MNTHQYLFSSHFLVMPIKTVEKARKIIMAIMEYLECTECSENKCESMRPHQRKVHYPNNVVEVGGFCH